MALESASFLNDLVLSNPDGADAKSDGDNHIRLMKAVLQATFPGMAGRVWRHQSKAAGYGIVATDNLTIINATAAITVTAAAVATLGNGFVFGIYAGTGNTTFDPNGVETVNGATTAIVRQGTLALFFCTGSEWIALGMPNAWQTPTGSGNMVLETSPTITSPDLVTAPTADTPSVGDNSRRIATTAFIAAAVANIQQSIWVPALAMVPRTTAGAAVNRIESSTNKVISQTMDFDAVTQEYAQFTVRMPQGWNEGTFTAYFLWSHPATATNFGVAWSLQAFARSDNEALDVSFGTEVVTTDTGGLTDTLYQSPVSAAMTVGQTPAENDFVQFQLSRKVADAGDTMSVDARLHGVLLIYTIDTLDDA